MSAGSITKNPIIQKLLSLNLPSGDFAVFGSGPIFAHGLKDSLRDLDLIARGAAWEKAKMLGNVEETKLKFGEVVLFDEEISVFNGWFPAGKWNIDELIDSAEVIEGIRFVRLEEVLKWKRMRNAPKDAEHIRLIEEYFKEKTKI